MGKKRDFTIAEYLAHMGKAVVTANIEAIKATKDILASNELDSDIPICEHTIHMDGTTLAPEGWMGLDKMEIECESFVHALHDEEGNPTGLAMSMKRGLCSKGMHVKFRANFLRSGTIEGIEIIREAGNQSLRRAIESQNITTNIDTREDNNV